jgi:hypothetical protein
VGLGFLFAWTYHLAPVLVVVALAAAIGHRDLRPAAAAGAGVLAVPGERFGFVFVDGQWSEAARPNAARSARILADGTLFALAGPGDVWLGGGSGAARLWSNVTVDAA